MSLIEKYFYPDYYFDDIYSITPQMLCDMGIKGLICDIDNTLEPYETDKPSERLLDWIEKMSNSGIAISFVSNNNIKRVELFNRDLQFYASAQSGKPSRRHLIKAIRHMETDLSNTAMLGDQLFTDIYAGKRLGILTILVKPINDKKTLFFRFKRFFEKIILKGYKTK